MLILFVALTGLMFYWKYENLKKEYKATVYSYTDNISKTLERCLDSVHFFAEELYHSQKGIEARNKENYSVMDAAGLMIEVKKKMESFFQSVYILNTNGETSLKVGNGVSFPIPLEEKIEALAIEQGLGSAPIVWSVKDHYYREEDIFLITFFLQGAKVGDSYYDGSVVVNLDANALSEILFSSMSQGGIELYIIEKNGTVVAHSDKECIGENWFDKSYIQEIIAKRGTFDSVVINDGMKLDVLAFKIAYDDFYIVAQSEHPAFFLHRLSCSAVWILILLFVLLLAAMYLILGELFRPFNELTWKIRDTFEGYDIYRMYDDVKFLECYHDLTSEYLRDLQIKEDKNLIVKSLLQDVWDQKMENFIMDKKIVIPDTKYCVILVRILIDEYINDDAINFFVKYRTITENLIEKEIRKEFDCTCLEFGLRKVLLVISHKNSINMKKDYLIQKLEEISQMLKIKYNVELMVASSECKESQTVSFDEMYHMAQSNMDQQLSHNCTENSETNNTDIFHQELIEKIVDYINNDYFDKELNVQKIARIFHMNHSYLGNLFLKCTGKNMNAYLLEVRMKKAHDILLTNATISISRIAELVGFNSSTYFATCFKSFYGISPSKVRELDSLNKKRLDGML